MNITEQQPLRMIQVTSWLLLGVMVVLGWFFSDFLFVRSLLVGGLLANISFILMKRDLIRLLQGDLAVVKARFFIKYYARLALITVILFFVVKFKLVQVIALLVGLSSVFLSIAAVAVYSAGKN